MPLSSREVIRRPEENGWQHVRTKGDHWHFKHPAKPGLTTVPHPVKDLKLKTLINIERQSGLKLRR